MEKNGRNSTTRRSLHINTRHLFAKDRVNKGELTVEHCPSKLMIANHITKLFQGKQFEICRSLIMEWKSANDFLLEIGQSAKENVGNIMVTDKSDIAENRHINNKSNSAENLKMFKNPLLGK